jgi:hypothetical protein
MANKSLLTQLAKASSVEQTVFSPVSTISSTGQELATPYLFLSNVTPWGDTNNPPDITGDQKTLKSALKNMFVAKRVLSSDIIPVIQRTDWTSGTVYEYYRDDIDITTQDINGNLFYNFFVMNRYYQVFKCLWNNKYAVSVDEPYFESGQFATNRIYTGPNDGYKWKYMFVVDSMYRNKFLDSNWIPVAPGFNPPSALSTGAGCGNIELLNIYSGGSGYNSTNAIISIVITGDGTSSTGEAGTTAAATATVSNGAIVSIAMSDTGKNYTFAGATVVSTLGSGCILGANTVSPIGGHGEDPIAELGCAHVMFSVEIDGSEGNKIPTDITYYQVGLILNPSSTANNTIANNQIYKTTYTLGVGSGVGTYTNSETVYQGDSLSAATFSGTVCSFDSANNVLYTINNTGTPSLSTLLIGNSSGVARTLLSQNPPDSGYILQSGYVVYLENRTGIQRSSDGIEQFKIVLGY